MVTTAWLGRAPITGEKKWPATRVSVLGKKWSIERRNGKLGFVPGYL
jgi:hypothetical protein